MDDAATLDAWITEVNSLGTESAITLIMSGMTVTGFITPTARYQAWLDEIANRAAFGERVLPSSEIGPISPEQSELVRKGWSESVFGEGDEVPKQFCLRDATILVAGDQRDWLRIPFLVVSRSAVAAFSPIMISS
ncbi:MAG: hypothetical protein JSW51_06185 [Gemmatimonadota bacterium]|nr:MAG: hypothetical protein JSW51_06185 [Gemmatimonadota bacterium]